MSGTQQLVQLIPVGNEENHIFAFKVVGGTPGFPGYAAEEFTGTTDGSGQMTVVLSRAPAHLAGCFCLTGEDERVIAPLSISSSTHLLLQKRKLVYDKPQDSGTNKTGLIHSGSQPGSVSIAASATNTGDTAPPASSSSSASTTGGPVGGGAGGAVISVDSVSTTTTVSAHHHSIDSVYDHKHDLAFTPTSLVPAIAEAYRVLVIYA